MRNRFFYLLLVAALLMTVLFIRSDAPASQASEAFNSQNATTPLSANPQNANLQEVPADIQALFADGITAEEFVRITGHVPSALSEMIEGDALMIIEFKDEPMATIFARERAEGRAASAELLQSYRQSLEAVHAAAIPAVEQLGGTVISQYTAAYNGLQVLVPLNSLNALRDLPNVKSVHPAPIHEITHAASVPLIGAPQVWEELEYKGEGMTIAIIDTGIDYTHEVFGGSGDPDDYADNNPNVIEPYTFPTAKVIAGYDFAGTLYHAGCTPANEAAGVCSVIPAPDPDPLDEGGHGTHVASSAAGMAAGDVAAGVAPEAKLVALKVFGRSGSTALVIDALDWATHNYMLFGWPQVINMSLGSNFGTNSPDNPSVAGSDNAATAGIVVVASAGNAGNTHYITGAPASADKAISVAASTTGFVTGPSITVESSGAVVIYNPGGFDDNTGRFEEPVTAMLAYVANLEGAANNLLCTTDGLAADALGGKIALIQRGACAFSDKVNNAGALGAVAAIIYNNAPGTLGAIGTPVTIPAALIQMADGVMLVNADGEMVTISAESDISTVPDPYTPADHIATFSSRGPRGFDSALKPEIAAPGVSIFGAAMGSGTGGVSFNGTSMAAPHVAGVAALMLQANPDRTPEQIKAAIMNTAAPMGDNTPIPRAGSGRIDAWRAVNADVIAIGNKDLVSLSWGVPMSRNNTVSRTDTVTVHNHGEMDQEYMTGWMFQTGSYTVGAQLAVEPEVVHVPAGGSAVVTVTLSLDMTAIPVLYGTNGLEEYYGWVWLTPVPVYHLYLPIIHKADEEAATVAATPAGSLAESAENLLVPFYFQPRPYSQLEEIAGDGLISDPVEGSATFELKHRGPITASLGVYPALQSMPEPNPAMAGPGDVRMLGMGPWMHGTYGDMVSVAINAHGYWHVPQPMFAEFDLYMDTDGDGIWDLVNFNYNLGWWQGGNHTNQWIVVQVDLATGNLFLGSPFLIYTDYNASLMEWYLPATWQDLGNGNTTFDYQLLGFDPGGMDVTPAGRFDYASPPFSFALSDDPGPADRDATLEVMVASQAGYHYSQPLGVMIVDYNGDPRNQNGSQAYFEAITVENLDVLDLTLLHTNDFHARVDQYNRSGARCTPAAAVAGMCIGGAPRVATVVNQVRAERDNVLVLDAGDQFQGTLFYGVYRGEVLNTTMNHIGYDAMVVGNHEFDSGPGVLADFINGADFPVLGANVDTSAEPALDGLILPWVILEVGGHEVGVIGVVTPDTANISSPGAVTFTDVKESLETAVAELEAEGIDKIIALTHIGYGWDLELVEEVDGVDIYIGGHSHSFLYYPAAPISFNPPTFPQFGPLLPVGEYPTVLETPSGAPALVVTAYQWGTFLGHLDVTFDNNGEVAYYGGNPIFLGSNIEMEAELDALLDPYRAGVQDLIDTPVGETTVDLLIMDGGQQICRLGECLMGNLVADAMLWKANQVNREAEYHIAFQNGGGLRAPMLAGPITMGDVLETLPFGNAIATFELQGQYVKAALENGANRYPAANGGFAQVSGLRYVINPDLPAFERVTSVDVWMGDAWEPLDMDAIYKVVTNDFMRRGGDNYLMFRDHAVNPYDFGPLLDEALAEYLGEFSPVTPEIEGRVVFSVLDLTILHTNDFHARVDQYNRSGARCTPAAAVDGLCIGGAPRVATVVNQMRADHDNVLVLDAGDQFQGTLFYGVYRGEVLNVTMNHIGYDAMVVGNHEFDSGVGVLADFIGDADFPVLGANVDTSAEPDIDGMILPWVILEVGGHEVGVIGVVTPDTANISSPGAIEFTDVQASLETAVAELTAEGVNKIIALTHVGYTFDLDLAASVAGIDIFIGGHSHSFLYYPATPISFNPPTFPQFGPLVPVGEYPTVVQGADGAPVLVVTAYQWGSFLGNLQVGFAADGTISYYGGNPIFLGSNIEMEAELDALLDPYRAGVQDLIDTPVGDTTVDLLIMDGGQQICRLGECLMGNLVADAMLWKANQVEPTANYRIAFQNGGGLRAPMFAGPITMGDVLETLPFGNAIATFELQGMYVKAALENGARNYPAANGGFAQVSGLRYEINPALPAQARVLNIEVWNGGGWDALDMNAMYKVVTNDFMRRGGDNYLMFRDHAVNPYDFGPLLDEGLADYLGDFSPVTPMIEGRVTFTPAP